MPKLAYRSTLPRPDDPQILDTIASDVRLGVPLRFAAVNAGISEHTAYHWVTHGERDLAEHPEELSGYALFGQVVKESRAALVREAVTEWRSAGKDWPKWATLMERLFPDEFGRSEHRYVRVDQRSLSVTITIPAVAEGELLALLQGRLAAGDTPLLPAPADITVEATVPDS